MEPDSELVKDLSQGAWSEVLGVVEAVTEDSIVLSCKQTLRIHIPKNNLETWKHLLRKGIKVAVLRLDDGSIRVRRIPRNKIPNSGSPAKGRRKTS